MVGRGVLAVEWHKMLVPDTPLLEIVVRGSLVYLALFTLLRVVLKRQSGGLGVTDLLVVVLIADAAQNAMAGDYTSVPDGVLLVAVIVGWAWLLDFAAYYVPFFARLVNPPKLPLVRDGQMLVHNMRRELVTREELMSQLREQGVADVRRVRAAYLEPDGRVSVLTDDSDESPRGTPQRTMS